MRAVSCRLIVEQTFRTGAVTDLHAQLKAVCTTVPRRFDRLSELLLLAAASVLGDKNAETCGLYVATAEGNFSGTMAYLQRLKEKGGRFANPIDFPNLLMSAAASNVSLHLGIKGTLLTFHQGDVGAFHALASACEALRNDRIDRAVVAQVEQKPEWAAAICLTHRTAHAGDIIVKEVSFNGEPPQLEGNLRACVAALQTLAGASSIGIEHAEHGSGVLHVEKL
jgi:hypothetical protein